MIKVEGENKTKYTDAVIYSYVYSAREYAIFSLKHFFDLLNINKTAFNHLYNTDIIIDYNCSLNAHSNRDIAYYEDNYIKTNNNRIVILAYYIENHLKNSNKISKKNIIKDIGETIIHETLHSNRDLILKNANNIFYLENLKNYYSLKPKDKKIYDECDNILNNYYDKCYKDNYIIILKVINKKDYIQVYTYDKIDNSYKIYNISDIKFDYSTDLYCKIVDYLDEYDIMPIKILQDFKSNTINDIYGIINLYATNKNIHNYNDVKKANYFLKYQYALEEALIEALTLIVSYHSNKNNIDIKSACEDIKYKRENIILKNGLNIFENANIEFIKWFLLSCYNDEYVDLLESMFSDEYNNLIKYFSILSDDYDKIIISKRYDDKINNIITKKLIKDK